ncbi:MAG: hypothetical protein B1H09_00855 [Gemmatimonadaceae bacterium 4484_173]|nr:MAG: hypothetical protein B1H09_00855 [Gemmatimonadaceae bacterium 4484_173]RKZ04803.1 MAG: hypothetical protein DRQ21_01540 [Candidatus Fermentibacteria bacterium]
MLPSGGGIRVVKQFTEGLAERFHVHLNRPDGGSRLKNLKNISETVYPYPLWRKPSGILRPVAPVFLIARLISFKSVCGTIAKSINSNADVALVHNSMPIAAPPVLDYLKIPALYYCFEHPRHIYESDIIKRTGSFVSELALKPLCAVEKRMDRVSVRNATAVATFSRYMKQNIKQYYHRDSTVIRPGIDTNFFCPAENTDSRENFVLSVGALWPYKGHETVIRILGSIPPTERPSLRIIADREYPGYSAQLSGLADRLSVEMRIEKSITNTELRTLYQNATAVLCCQRREPYGLVPLEAMACRTPVIAISEGGFPDNIIHGETGFLFDGTVQSGAELLARVLHIRNSDMEENAYAFVTGKRNLKSGIQELTTILEEL